MIVAGYTEGKGYDDWLGGEDAYISQTIRMVERIERQANGLLIDPMFVGRMSSRDARAITAAIQELNKYAADPVQHQKRINYHACGVARTLAESKVSINYPEISLLCELGKSRTSTCIDALDQLGGFEYEGPVPPYSSVCNWTIENNQ